MRTKGKLIKWHEDKGFGFIAPSSGGKNVFIHKTALHNKSRVPKLNDIITFTMSMDKAGRDCASEATFTGEKLPIQKAYKPSMLHVYLSVMFLATISVGYVVGVFPRTVVLLYYGLSIAAFLAYAWDKSKAQQGEWRTPESTLHMMSLMGGWPGAAFAQHFLRHKSSKKPFRVSYWFTVFVNLAALGWLIWSDNKLWSTLV